MPHRIAIIGAGPVGLEAALGARSRGYQVQLFERGDRPASAMRLWGHVRMFSPFSMNASKAGIAALQSRGLELPPADALLTGHEFAESYLEPVARCLGDCVHLRTEVRAIGRSRTFKGEKIGEPERGTTPFRLLVRRDGEERVEEAEVVFDCSGTFLQANPLGDGGLPAPGEALCRAEISYGIPEVLGAARSGFGARRVLVVGGGHSAATVVRDLAILKRAAPQTSIVWCVRSDLSLPCRRIAADPLPARDQLAAEVNALVTAGVVEFRPGSLVQALRRTADGVEVILANAVEQQSLIVDRIVAAVGFRPDLELARELQVQTCYATEGTYPLAASLLGETGGDCLRVRSGSVETLKHPEPGYFTLGMKSYGRFPDFLIRTGIKQVETVLDSLNGA